MVSSSVDAAATDRRQCGPRSQALPLHSLLDRRQWENKAGSIAASGRPVADRSNDRASCPLPK
jgi:hypothetical protein